jgi:hypothetical protein
MTKAWRLLLIPVFGAGCGSFVAYRVTQAPNTNPAWLALPAPVLLSFDGHLLTNFPSHFAEVGPPTARLHYRRVALPDIIWQ